MPPVMSIHWIVVVSSIVNILATAIIVLSAAVRLGHRLGGIETKVDAMWSWFCVRTQNANRRAGD